MKYILHFLFIAAILSPSHVLAQDYAFSGSGYTYQYSDGSRGIVSDRNPWKSTRTALSSDGKGSHLLVFGNCVFSISSGFDGVHPGIADFAKRWTQEEMDRTLPATFAGRAVAIGPSNVTSGSSLPFPCANNPGGFAIAIVPVKEGISFRPGVAPSTFGKEVGIVFYGIRGRRDIHQILIPLSQDFFTPSEKALAQDLVLLGLSAAINRLTGK